MSIDGIGRPPRPPGDVGVNGPSPAAGESFSVDRPQAATSADASSPLAALERGEITVEQYLTARVDEAVAPFAERLAPEQLEFMRSSLRSALATDPVLVELVRRATGVTPTSEP
jgi:hypothetical protein